MCQIVAKRPFDRLWPSQIRKVASLSAQALSWAARVKRPRTYLLRGWAKEGQGEGVERILGESHLVGSQRRGSHGRAAPRTLLRARADDGTGRQCQGANPGCPRRRRAPRVAPSGGIRRGAGARGDPLLGYCKARLRQDLKIAASAPAW